MNLDSALVRIIENGQKSNDGNRPKVAGVAAPVVVNVGNVVSLTASERQISAMSFTPASSIRPFARPFARVAFALAGLALASASFAGCADQADGPAAGETGDEAEAMWDAGPPAGEEVSDAPAAGVELTAGKPAFQLPFPCDQVWTGQTRTDHSPQNSVDFNRANDDGDTVVAAARGTVTRVENLGDTSYGRWVEISHGDGWTTRYAHLSVQSVVKGQSVNQGQKIGNVGNTGGSSGPHLHFEERQNGAAVRASFNGATALYFGSKSYTSRNACGGGGGAVGHVDTNGAPLTVRSGPGTNFSAVGSVADGASVTISCQKRGESVTGTFGTSNLWDKIGAGFVADAFVATGSDGQVAPTCPLTPADAPFGERKCTGAPRRGRARAGAPRAEGAAVGLARGVFRAPGSVGAIGYQPGAFRSNGRRWRDRLPTWRLPHERAALARSVNNLAPSARSRPARVVVHRPPRCYRLCQPRPSRRAIGLASGTIFRTAIRKTNRRSAGTPGAKGTGVMNERTLGLSLVLLLAFSTSACDDSSDPGGESGSPGGSTAGAGGGSGGGGAPSGAGGSGASSGAAGAQVASAFDTLAACAVEEPCAEPSSAQLVENTSVIVDERRARCVAQGLRDRKPGRYFHDTDHTFGNGSVGVHHALIVSADGSAHYARDVYGVAGDGDPPAQRCQLAEASYFASCLAALDGEDTGANTAAIRACLFGDGSGVEPSELAWFASCADEAPRCE